MPYRTRTIANIIRDVNQGNLCLPAIQRKFIWKPSQIEKLFDSIYHGYPIGTFLFWEVLENNTYKFYEILKEYNEQTDGNYNPTQPRIRHDYQLHSVLDGQQRITSIYLGIEGSYTTKNLTSRRGQYLYTKRELYFNLLGFRKLTLDTDENLEESKLFKFLSTEEKSQYNVNDNYSWIKLKDLIDNQWLNGHLEDENEYSLKILKDNIGNDNWYNLFENNPTLKRKYCIHTDLMAKMIQSEEIISYYEINRRITIAQVTEIFIRINSGGVKLSKTDLLFSLIISNWEEGRDKIDDLIKDIDELQYEIDTDFVMRTALYLTGSDILFKVENFANIDIVESIKENFEIENGGIGIRAAITETFIFLRNKLGIHAKTLSSLNMLIPLIYHVYKGGKLNDDSIFDVKKYLYITLLQKVFGSHGDSLLTQLRKGVTIDGSYSLLNQNFNFTRLINGITDNDKRDKYNLTENNIEDFLSRKYGGEAWLVLSLIYDGINHQYGVFDQDHLHPKSKLVERNFNNIDFKTEIDSRKNCVPNLCFLTREDNRTEKRAKQLIDYVGNLRNQASFKERNFIDNETSLELTNFIEFYEKRKQSLKIILINKLGVTVQNENEQVNGPINLANNIPQINNQENFDNDNNYVQLNLTEVNPIVDLAENNVLNNTNQIIRNPIIIGIEINGNALIIGDNNPNTTTCYKAFFEYIIENHSDRFINSEILQRYFKTDKNYPSFTYATIGYNRVREFQNFFYHDYQDSARKKEIIESIATELGLRIRFTYG